MKRSKLLLGVLICSVLLITGCTPKESTLICTQNVSGVDIEFNIDFAGKNIKNIDLNYSMDLSKYSSTQIKAISKQDFCSKIKKSMSQFKDAFTTCDQDVSDKKLTVKSNLDSKKISSSYLKGMTSPEATKKTFEGQKYTCELK